VGRWWANQISERANAENHIVVYATWEQSVEELHSFMVAADEQLSVTNMARGEISDDEWSRILRSGVDRILQPLWFIGHSLERRKKRPAMNVTTLAEALRKIEDDYGKIIDMVFIDYLQRIPAEGRVESKAIATSDILDRLKDGALAFGCPFVVGYKRDGKLMQGMNPFLVWMMVNGLPIVSSPATRYLALCVPANIGMRGKSFWGGMLLEATRW
jgi:Replicative DNA helicase